MTDQKPPFLTAAAFDARHAFFTREGGVSTGPYESLNLKPGKGENPVNIDENKRRMAAALNYSADSLTVLHQTCGSDVVINPKPGLFQQEGDAIVTDRSGLAIGVITADCVPILLKDKVSGLIGACHGSRPGLIDGIIAKTVQAMLDLGGSSDPNQIEAAIGPCIHQDNYEVGPEIYDRFVARDPALSGFFSAPHDDIGRRYLDLPGFADHLLRASGLKHIYDISLDTYSDPQRFFSYRRNTHQSIPSFGDQLSVIVNH